MNHVYREKIYLPLVFLLISLAVIVVLIVAWIQGDFIQDKVFAVISICTMIAVLFSTLNFGCLEIRATETLLKFRFGLFKKEVFIKNIVELKVEKFSVARFGGYGLRIGKGNILGYIAKSSQGIEFKNSNSNKKYFLSTNNADELFNILVTYGAKKT